MSTLTYATLTTRRLEAPPGLSDAEAPPGVKSYVDATAALVPAEVLTLHALVLSVTTETKNATTVITDAGTLQGAFFGLLVVSIVLYVLPRRRTWGRLDWVRAMIPPTALVAWTMLQKATAFDAVVPRMADTQRTVIALFLAVALGVVATVLAKKADSSPPTQ